MSGQAKKCSPNSKWARHAKRWFKYQGLEGAPALPLLPQDRHWLLNMKESPLGYITACYATSVESCGYDIYTHPDALTYACGLMACSSVPEEVRNDPEMLRRFPPKKLAGLDETTLCWRQNDDEAAEAA